MEWTNLAETAVAELMQASTCSESHIAAEMAAYGQPSVPEGGSTMDLVHDRVLLLCPEPGAMTILREAPGMMIFPEARRQLLQLLLQLAV